MNGSWELVQSIAAGASQKVCAMGSGECKFDERM
jgi:hypothetical protein